MTKARDVFQQLHLAREKGLHIRKPEFNFAMDSVMQGGAVKLPDLQSARIQISAKKPPIAPKTLQQKNYVESIKTNDLIFGVGPAGTGKTFLAMAMAVAALKNEEVTRIVLTRPAVEAGEALGFLPGDLQEKIFPYLRPLYDALNDMLEVEEIQRYMDKGIIEIAPLAYMRGRTLSRSFIILDEGQKHDDRADVHVPDPAWAGLEVRGHGRSFAGRSAALAQVRPDRGGAGATWHGGHSLHPLR